MTDTQHNTDKNRSSHHHPDVNADGERETFTHQPHHDTHVIAIVAMTIIVLGVVWVAITSPKNTAQMPTEGNEATSSQAADEAAGTPGPAVPQREVAVNQSDSVDDLPGDLFVNADALVSNNTTEFGERIVAFTTDRAFRDLADAYQNFLRENNYELIQDMSEDRTQKLAATGESGEQLTIIISQTDSTNLRRVKISYLAS